MIHFFIIENRPWTSKNVVSRFTTLYIILFNSISAKACGKAIVFNCGHKFHTSCLSQAGCQRQVFGRNEESWLCYICLKHQAFSLEDKENEIIVDKKSKSNNFN